MAAFHSFLDPGSTALLHLYKIKFIFFSLNFEKYDVKLHYFALGKSQKKFFLRVDSPLTPLAPPPFGLVVKRKATNKKKH